MRVLVLVLANLVCAGHTRRVRATSESWENSLDEEGQDSQQDDPSTQISHGQARSSNEPMQRGYSSEALAKLLLSVTPSSGFNIPSTGRLSGSSPSHTSMNRAHLVERRHAGHRSRNLVTMMPSEVAVKDAKSGKETEAGEEEEEIPPEVEQLFTTLRGEALRRLEEFDPTNLFSLYWAYAYADLLDEDLHNNVTAAATKLGKSRDAEVASKKRSKPGDKSLDLSKPKDDEPYVLAEGDHWMGFYKPPGWLINVDSTEARKKGQSTTPLGDEDEGDAEEGAGSGRSGPRPQMHPWINAKLGHMYPICGDPLESHGLMHRLDGETSGVLLFAKSYTGAYSFRLQWCVDTVEKYYVCLVHGHVDQSQREIQERIRIEKQRAENSRKVVATHCTISPSGKPSFTEIATLAHLVDDANEPYSLVAVKLHTGRTHQIRVHMKHIGHPLVCDPKYGGRFSDADSKWCERHFLHTHRLGFADVGTEGADITKPVSITCPLPKDLRDALGTLKPVDDRSAKFHEDWLSGDSDRICDFDVYAEEIFGPDTAESAPTHKKTASPQKTEAEETAAAEIAEKDEPAPSATETTVEKPSTPVKKIAVEEPAPADVPDLSSLTVAQLKEQLKAKGMKVGGTKAQLIERLSVEGAPSPPSAPKSPAAVAPAADPAPSVEPEKLTVAEAPAPPPAPKSPAAVAPAADPAPSEDLEKLTVAKLKDLCREKGLLVGGTKAVLIERLKSAP